MGFGIQPKYDAGFGKTQKLSWKRVLAASREAAGIPQNLGTGCGILSPFLPLRKEIFSSLELTRKMTIFGKYGISITQRLILAQSYWLFWVVWWQI